MIEEKLDSSSSNAGKFLPEKRSHQVGAEGNPGMILQWLSGRAKGATQVIPSGRWMVELQQWGMTSLST